jgi:hypothetical protein
MCSYLTSGTDEKQVGHFPLKVGNFPQGVGELDYCLYNCAAIGILVVVVLLPLSLAMDKAEAIARGQQ